MRRPFVGSARQLPTPTSKARCPHPPRRACWAAPSGVSERRFSYIAAGKAGAAISYALGQGAPMVAAVWGVFVWKEFKGADRKTNTLLAVMFLFFIARTGFDHRLRRQLNNPNTK